ncbi:MarR family transcriptional regulator [Streptomyces sp. NPDC006516]|uniref:MarR family winged helix-turn-helix transcriptional regulator n=1 Tax=Streptomyces sp. NPDC006516 TaxID=3154309 RepID=UPI0033BD6F95
MREDSVPDAQDAPDGSLDAGHLLELLEIAWERGRDAFDTAPVSPTQTRVMYVVEREPGINMRDLGRHLAMAAPSVSRLCDRLQATGFLRRTPRAEDRREMELRLTEVGRAHLRMLRHRREQYLRKTIGEMPPAARHALTAGLSAFCEAAGGPPLAASRPPHERRRTA